MKWAEMTAEQRTAIVRRIRDGAGALRPEGTEDLPSYVGLTIETWRRIVEVLTVIDAIGPAFRDVDAWDWDDGDDRLPVKALLDLLRPLVPVKP